MILKGKTSALLYISYGIILTGALLFFRFPKEQLQHFVIDQIEKTLPGTSCTIESLSYSFPLSLQAKGIKIVNQGESQSKPFEIERAILKPQIVSPHKVAIAAQLYGGYFAGILERDTENNQMTVANYTLKDLRVEDLLANFALSQYPISGLIEVSGSYNIDLASKPALPTYSGKLIIRNGTIKTEHPVLSLNTIDMRYVEMTFTRKNSTIEITHGKMQGSELDSTFTGTIQPLQPLGQSSCQIEGQLVPRQSFLETKQTIKDQAVLLQKQAKQHTIPYSASGQLANLTFGFKQI